MDSLGKTPPGLMPPPGRPDESNCAVQPARTGPLHPCQADPMKNGSGNAPSHVVEVLSLIPESVFVLTSATEHTRRGLLVNWVQRCAGAPPMVMVALPVGQSVEPVILESRSFALCQLPADNCFLTRRYANAFQSQDDPFFATSTRCAPSGAPIIDTAVAFLDCELVRRLDLESDSGIYIGAVKHGGILNDASPSIRIGVSDHDPFGERRSVTGDAR